MLATSLDWTDLVPVGALVFTVASFWWIYLRRGRLRATPPHVYASSTTSAKVRIRLPLVIFNTGAAAIVVEDLRLVVDGHELEWISLRRTIRPMTDDVLDFAAPFAIAGREARQIFAEFGQAPAPLVPELGASYPARIDRKIGGKWKPLLEFEWWAPKNDPGPYIAHRNSPDRGAAPVEG